MDVTRGSSLSRSTSRAKGPPEFDKACKTAAAQRNARESKARELAALVIAGLNEDPERSILLGMEDHVGNRKLG
jgi:hypothetical protein